MPAVYFITPSPASVARLVADYSTAPGPYPSVHVFFSSRWGAARLLLAEGCFAFWGGGRGRRGHLQGVEGLLGGGQPNNRPSLTTTHHPPTQLKQSPDQSKPPKRVTADAVDRIKRTQPFSQPTNHATNAPTNQPTDSNRRKGSPPTPSTASSAARRSSRRWAPSRRPTSSLGWWTRAPRSRTTRTRSSGAVWGAVLAGRVGGGVGTVCGGCVVFGRVAPRVSPPPRGALTPPSPKSPPNIFPPKPTSSTRRPPAKKADGRPRRRRARRGGARARRHRGAAGGGAGDDKGVPLHQVGGVGGGAPPCLALKPLSRPARLRSKPIPRLDRPRKTSPWQVQGRPAPRAGRPPRRTHALDADAGEGAMPVQSQSRASPVMSSEPVQRQSSLSPVPCQKQSSDSPVTVQPRNGSSTRARARAANTPLPLPSAWPPRCTTASPRCSAAARCRRARGATSLLSTAASTRRRRSCTSGPTRPLSTTSCPSRAT